MLISIILLYKTLSQLLFKIKTAQVTLKCYILIYLGGWVAGKYQFSTFSKPQDNFLSTSDILQSSFWKRNLKIENIT